MFTRQVMERLDMVPPNFSVWTIEPHKEVSRLLNIPFLPMLRSTERYQVPFQANWFDCGIFTLLFIRHLCHGYLNANGVPLEYRFDMGELKGQMAGDLCGARLALVEELLIYSNRKEPECMKVVDDKDEVIEISSDSEAEL